MTESRRRPGHGAVLLELLVSLPLLMLLAAGAVDLTRFIALRARVSHIAQDLVKYGAAEPFYRDYPVQSGGRGEALMGPRLKTLRGAYGFGEKDLQKKVVYIGADDPASAVVILEIRLKAPFHAAFFPLRDLVEAHGRAAAPCEVRHAG